MNNFVYHNPTKLVFGKGQIAQLAKLIPAGKKIMITCGGGSVRRNGIYDQVVKALEGRDWVEFWGIEPNPSVETVREAIALGREHGSEFLLAVGGGSVIDGTKLIAAGLLYDGDPWEIVLKGQADKTVPLGTVLTMSATGSEMNNGSVISCQETKEKFPFNGDYPLFSILDPEALFSLPQKQIAYGLADTYVHVLEQYMTTPGQSRLMDRWAEGILHTVIEIAPRIRENQHDYAVMSEYMLAATLALNDMIRMGVAQDWATHMIGHELTALHGLTHGATLAIVINGTLRVLREQKRDIAPARILRHSYPAAAERLLNRYATYNDEVALAKEYGRDGRVLILAPDDLCGLSTLSKSFEGLELMYRKGYAAAGAIANYLAN